MTTLSYSQYQDLIRPAKRALRQLELDLAWHLEDIGDWTVHEVKTRIKDYHKLVKKLESKPYESVDEVTDLAGMRIVVHAKTDVEAIVALFKGQEIRQDLEILEDVQKEDSAGYAARHLVVNVKPSYRRSAFDVKIEIQVRTLAEDLFDTLSRRMWYKSSIKTEDASKNLVRSLVEKLREVDAIVLQLREKWEDAYAQTSPDSEMTPHSFRRIVAEIFHEKVPVDDAVETVRFLRDRGVKLNRHLRSIFTDPNIRSDVEALISWNPKIFDAECQYGVYIMAAAHPGIAELLRQINVDNEKRD